MYNCSLKKGCGLFLFTADLWQIFEVFRSNCFRSNLCTVAPLSFWKCGNMYYNVKFLKKQRLRVKNETMKQGEVHSIFELHLQTDIVGCHLTEKPSFNKIWNNLLHSFISDLCSWNSNCQIQCIDKRRNWRIKASILYVTYNYLF